MLYRNDILILYHLSKNVKTVDLIKHIPVSQGTIERRKKKLKKTFLIDDSDDSELIRVAEDVDYNYSSEEIEKLEYKYLLDVDEIETKEYFDSKVNSKRKRDKFYKYLDTKSFHFWQTGVAKRYRYKTPNNLTERLELWFTVV